MAQTLLNSFVVDNIQNNGSTGNWYKMKVDVYLNTPQDIPNNRSNITLKAFFATKESYAGWSTHSTPYLKTYLSINNGALSLKTNVQIKDMPQNSANTWRQFGEWTGYVSHRTDGSQNIKVKIEFTRATTASYMPENANKTFDNISLPDIPRASTIVSATIAGAIKPNKTQDINISLDKKYNGYTHNINLYDGDKFIGEWLNQSEPTTLTLNTTHIDRLLTAMSTRESKSFTLGVTTLSGETIVGSRETKNITIQIDSSVKPMIENVSISIYGNGHDKSINKYIQNVSRAKVSYSRSAGYGATISSSTVKIGKANIISGNDITSNVINEKGDIDILITVKDSRGRISTYTEEITVFEYNLPSIGSFIAKRSDSNTEEVDISSSGNWTYLNGDNKLDIYIDYREIGEEWGITPLEDLKNQVGGNFNHTITKELNDEKSFELRLTILDQFGQTATAITTIGTARVALAIKRDIGISVGKLWEEGGDALQVSGGGSIEGGLNVEGDIFQNGNELFGIVESGSNANGFYIKFGDGTMICHHEATHTNLAMTSLVGTTGFYENDTNLVWQFPDVFIDRPNVLINPRLAGANRYLTFIRAIATTTSSYTVASTGSITVNMSVSLTAIGRWK